MVCSLTPLNFCASWRAVWHYRQMLPLQEPSRNKWGHIVGSDLAKPAVGSSALSQALLLRVPISLTWELCGSQRNACLPPASALCFWRRQLWCSGAGRSAWTCLPSVAHLLGCCFEVWRLQLCAVTREAVTFSPTQTCVGLQPCRAINSDGHTGKYVFLTCSFPF